MIVGRGGAAAGADRLFSDDCGANRRVARFLLSELPRVPPTARPLPAVLLLARPGPESDDLFADLDGRDDLCLLRAATAAAAARAAPEPSAAAVTIPIDCTLEEAERRIVLAALRHHGTRARTARALGIGLRTLYTKLAAWGAAPEDADSA